MATPEVSPQEPRLITFLLEPLKVEGQVRIDNPAMDTLTEEDRMVLVKAMKTVTLFLALSIELKPDMDINPTRRDLWAEVLNTFIQETGDSIGRLEGKIVHGPLSGRLLGLTDPIQQTVTPH